MRTTVLLVGVLITSACRSTDDGGGGLDTGALRVDADGDGYTADDDCDDNDALVNRAAPELCDGLDNDCDGVVDEGVVSVFFADADADGFGDESRPTEACVLPAGHVVVGNDCHDDDAESYPGAPERCDALDNDCDGDVDEGVQTDWFADADGDGYGDPGVIEPACDPPTGYVERNDDCDDDNAAAFPGGVEICDEADNDCDGRVDEAVTTTFYQDVDDDRYGVADITVEACDVPSGYAALPGDCDDRDAAVSPEMTELCNRVDDDCDGTVDEDDAADASVWYADTDRDGYGDEDSRLIACAAPTGYVSDDTDCDDVEETTNPGADERCDAVDNDCDGTTDEDDAVDAATFYADADGDGFGDAGVTDAACAAPTGYVSDDTDCDDAAVTTFPGADEFCDDVDNDCDETVDEDDAVDAPTWYADTDGDDFGDPDAPTRACSQPTGYLADRTDCDDAAATTFPGADEFCDDVDNDCDETVDEDDAVDALTWYADSDADGYGTSVSTVACAQPAGYAGEAGDCDDGEARANPGTDEVCDEIDNNCDGETDEGVTTIYYLDADGDTFGDTDESAVACSAPSSRYVTASGDCDDLRSNVYPGAPEGCDGDDYDCDGDIDNDFDKDGYTDASCGGEDCDDRDASVEPEDCPVGTDCDNILDNDASASDGYYLIDVDGYGTGEDTEEVYCDMTTDGGGWTLIATNADDGSWTSSTVINSTTFGTVSLTKDYKAEAWNTVPFTDVMFDDGTDYAVYDDVGDGTASWDDEQSAVSVHNCSASYAMSAGTFSGGRLCTTTLYLHPIDRDGGLNSSCSSSWIYSDHGFGPTWSARNNNGCPLDDPSVTGFYNWNASLVPWSSPLLMFVR
ncbi:MAG: MopE-related protein [Myxococcota bacterium]